MLWITFGNQKIYILSFKLNLTEVLRKRNVAKPYSAYEGFFVSIVFVYVSLTDLIIKSGTINNVRT